MSAHDVKLFGDQIAASRLETRFARLKASSLLRLAIEDLYPGRIALVSSFGADAAALLHMVAQIDKGTPVVFVDTGQHFPETLAYRDDLVARLGLTNIVVAEPKAETLAQEDPEKFLFMSDPDRSPRRLTGSTPGSPAGKVSRANCAQPYRCSRRRASGSRSIRWSAGARATS